MDPRVRGWTRGRRRLHSCRKRREAAPRCQAAFRFFRCSNATTCSTCSFVKSGILKQFRWCRPPLPLLILTKGDGRPLSPNLGLREVGEETQGLVDRRRIRKHLSNIRLQSDDDGALLVPVEVLSPDALTEVIF